MAVLANPFLLLIVLVLGIAVFVVGVTIMVVWGLETAFLLTFVFGFIVLTLYFCHAIDLEKQPLPILLIPLGFLMGYGLQHLSLFSIAPPPVNPLTSQASLTAQGWLAIEVIAGSIIFALLVSLGVYLHKRR